MIAVLLARGQLTSDDQYCIHKWGTFPPPMYRRLAASEMVVFPSDIPVDPSLLSWRVSSSILHVIAVSSSLYRLWERFGMHRAWWDDYVLFLPLVMDVFFAISLWFTIPQDRVSLSEEKVAYALVVLNSYWFTRFTFIVIVWSTRIVLSLSLARLFPKFSRPRICSMVLVAIMASFLVASILVSATTCHRKTVLLLTDEAADCISSVAGVAVEDVFLFAGDIIGDSLLVLCPIFWFWRIRLPPKERQLILLAFCGNILTLLSAIAFISLSKLAKGRDNAAMSRIEAAISLFVCNFTVVTTALYRVVRRQRASVPVPTATATASRAPTNETSLGPTGAYPLTQFPIESSSGSSPTPLTLTEISSFSSLRDSFMGNPKDTKLTANSIT